VDKSLAVLSFVYTMKRMEIFISRKIQEKLDHKHGGVSMSDIRECFANRDGKFLRDTRANHQTNPPTQWFIAETNFGRELKIAFLERDGNIHIKTAYEPNDDEHRAYTRGNK
jgi:uncharacterized DUF497 family protein